MDISIIVPTYNRKEKLKLCLDSLFRQAYPPKDFEVIVVDDGSADGTSEMVKKLSKGMSGVNLRYFSQGHKGPAAARNLGAKVSLGEIIGFIDDDCVVYQDWARLMTEAHRRNYGLTVIGGLTLVSNLKSTVLASQFLSNLSIETDFNGRREVIFFPTCNVSLKRMVFDKNKFNENFPLPGGEDLEFFWRIFKQGQRFAWEKNIKVVHYREDSTASFIKQAYIYGRGNFLVQHLHEDQPLLKELKTGELSFWAATLINILKIPRFSYILGSLLIQESRIKQISKKLSIYAYFILHKIFYIIGNMREFLRVNRNKTNEDLNTYHLPELIILDVTHSCNLHCRICDIWQTAQSEKDIGIYYIKKLLLQAKALMIKGIALSGGEALLRKDIFEIFDYARDLEIKNLGILTNGILVKEYFPRIKPYLIDNTISLVISLDSLKYDLHNQIRDSDSAWQSTVEALKMLSMMKKEYAQINFNIISIILNQNLEELPDLAKFVKSLGANSLQFQTFLPNNLKMAERKKSVFWVTEERLSILDKIVDRLVVIKNGDPVFIKNSVRNLLLIKQYYRGTLTSADVKCLSTYNTVLISNQGTYTTCFKAYANLRDQSLEDVLKSKHIIQAREEVQSCSWPCLLPCFCD